MLFQNSCDVPLGMTAMVSFFPVPAPFGPERLQPKTATAMQTANIKIILRIVCFSFIFVFRITLGCPQLQPEPPPDCLRFRALRFQLPSGRHLSEIPAACAQIQRPTAYPWQSRRLVRAISFQKETISVAECR